MKEKKNKFSVLSAFQKKKKSKKCPIIEWIKSIRPTISYIVTSLSLFLLTSISLE
jgi:hypothetical protein